MVPSSINLFSLFLVISSFCIVTNAVYECGKNTGIYQCHLSPWGAWSKCNVSCGGGAARRFRPLCCNSNYTSISLCAKDCNISKSTYLESKPCGQTCNHGGLFRQNVCQCTHGYTGKCCDNKTIATSTATGLTPDTCRSVCDNGQCENGICVCDMLYKGDNCKQFTDWFLPATIIGGILLLLLLFLCMWCLYYFYKKDRGDDNEVKPLPQKGQQI